ncbi:MAG TPA: carboxypeptidase-like regulatory domain-containing protein, partial [Pirellulales bacterium]
MPILLHTMLLLAAMQASEPATTLTSTLSGTVVAADGKPVAGAIVVIAAGEPVRRSVVRAASAAAPQPPEVLAKATSDATGKFSISLPDETPESPLQRTRLTVWAHHVDSSLAVRLIDRDWPKAGLPLSLRLPLAATVRFKVTDAGYRSAAHAQIAPLRVAGQLVPEIVSARLTARTDAEGKATLTGLVPSELETVRVESGASGAQWAGLPADRGKIVLVSLAPVGQLRGRLTADEPRAIARKRLRFATWQVPGDEHSGGGLAAATTDDEGRFEVPPLAAGSLTFEILEDGLPSPSRFNSTGDQRDPASEPSSAVYLTAQATGPAIEAGETTTFDIPLRRAVRVTQQVIEAENHAPVAGVGVWIRTGITAGMICETDASGHLTGYALPGLVSSRLLRFPASYHDLKGGRSSGTEVAESATPVSLKALELARGAPLHGRVVDENQRPLAGAEITGFGASVGDLTVRVHGWSNAQGEFTLDGVPEQATVSLWARLGELTSVQPVLAGPQGAAATLIVGNEPGVSLDGRVVDAAGQPIAGAIVRVCTQRVAAAVINNDLGPVLFGASDRLITDLEGRFRTPPSCRPNATYWLEVEAPGMISARSSTIEPDSWHTTHFDDVELRAMPRLRAVSGRVVDGQGNAVAAVEICQSGDGPRRTRATTHTDGRFQLNGVYDGPAYLFARKLGFRLQGVRIAAADKTCLITMRQSDEPPLALTTLPPAMPPDERRALARELVEPLVPMLSQPVLGREHKELLRIVARANPIKGLELADTVLGDPEFKSIARQYAALSLLTIDFEEALVIIALLDPQWRAETCVQGYYELIDAPLERKIRLLDEALIHARSQVDPGQRAYELGRIAECWL